MERAGAINIYICERCHAAIKTVNRDTGVTPFVKRCVDPECKDGYMLHSQLYQTKGYQNVLLSAEWYAPTKEELEAYIAEAGEEFRDDIVEYLKGGAMLFRAITPETIRKFNIPAALVAKPSDSGREVMVSLPGGPMLPVGLPGAAGGVDTGFGPRVTPNPSGPEAARVWRAMAIKQDYLSVSHFGDFDLMADAQAAANLERETLITEYMEARGEPREIAAGKLDLMIRFIVVGVARILSRGPAAT